MALRKRRIYNNLLRNYMENANIRRLLKAAPLEIRKKQNDGRESRIKEG